jgi:hypothetical protein
MRDLPAAAAENICSGAWLVLARLPRKRFG